MKVLLHNQELCAISGNTKRNSKLWKLTTKSDPISTLLFVITYNNVSHLFKKIRNTKRFENCNQTFLYTIYVEDAKKFSKRHLTVLNSCRYLFLRMVFWLHQLVFHNLQLLISGLSMNLRVPTHPRIYLGILSSRVQNLFQIFKYMCKFHNYSYCIYISKLNKMQENNLN